MIKKIKASKSEKIIFFFVISLAIFSLSSFFLIKNKCLFVKNYNPEKLSFDKPNNIAILNVECGNVIIELYPNISPNAVERFKTLVRSKAYDDIAFHRVIKDSLVQAGDLEFGKKGNIDYGKIGTGQSGLGTINSEIDVPFKICKYSPVGIRLLRRFPINGNKLFKSGNIEIQGEASQLSALILGAKPGMQVADICAGAGGKSLVLADIMKNKGRILSLDINQKRLKQASLRFKRAGVHNVEIRLGDINWSTIGLE